MPSNSALFKEFELYRDFAKNWDLDFRLLSENDFGAYLKIFTNSYFELARTSLNGKIEQQGGTLSDYRSIVVPLSQQVEFIWYNQKVTGGNLLIFPKDSPLDAISFTGFDVYVISINESVLYEMLDQLNYNYATKLFNEACEQVLHLDPNFKLNFHHKAAQFLDAPQLQTRTEQELINDLIFYTLKNIERLDRGYDLKNKAYRKRDIALKKAVKQINLVNRKISVQQLCKETGVSERTLEYAFLETYQLTPHEYIKAHRLNMVKKELILQKGSNAKVSQIAANYDFWHMGQFAKDFKRHFGVLPSQILKA